MLTIRLKIGIIPVLLDPYRSLLAGRMLSPNGLGLPCRVQKPSVDEPWPVIVYLHGAGERGGGTPEELPLLLKHGPWNSPGIDEFLVVAPQCPRGLVWPGIVDQLATFVRGVCERYAVDRSRVHLVGTSMGAFGAFAVATVHPQLFAAIVPIAGGFSERMPESTTIGALKRVAGTRKSKDILELVTPIIPLPMQIHHGADDSVVGASASRQAFNALRMGAKKRRQKAQRHFLTVHVGLNHAPCWKKVFKSQGFCDWIRRQRRRVVHQ